MIFELVKLIERELGHPLPGTTAHRVQADFCATYGGERIYVPRLPKRQHQVALTMLGTVNGLSVRHVRRIVRGK